MQTSHSLIPPTYLEQKRAEAQRLYKEEQAYLAAHKAEYDKLLEEDKQAMAKEMPGSLLGLINSLAGQKPQDEGDSQKTTTASGEGQGKL